MSFDGLNQVRQFEPDALLTLNDDVLERVTYDLLILSRSVLPVSASDRKRSSSIHWTGEIASFTGISDPYEAPQAPAVEVRTDRDSPDVCAAQIIAVLEARGLA